MKRKDYIIVGNVVESFIGSATTTLTTAFILSLGNNVYQLSTVCMMAIRVVVSSIMLKNTKLAKIGYRYFRLFMVAECVVDVACGIGTIVTKTAWIAFIASIVSTPSVTIERIGVNELTARAFNDADSRLAHDNKWSLIQPFVSIAGGLLGFALNMCIDGATAFTLIYLMDIINNLCFVKQYDEVRKESH